MAGVPLSQIHYHFGSKKNLVLAVLEENRRLLERQAEMYGTGAPLWMQWEQACDFLDNDLDSGYVSGAPGDDGGGLVRPRNCECGEVLPQRVV